MSLLDFDTDGTAAPPRLNGELMFSAPWESRCFAMALSLSEQGMFTLDQFREHLIGAIKDWEAGANEDDSYQYYERWQEALESIVKHFSLVPDVAFQSRIEEFADRPHGHDH